MNLVYWNYELFYNWKTLFSTEQQARKIEKSWSERYISEHAWKTREADAGLATQTESQLFQIPLMNHINNSHPFRFL